MKSRFNTLDTIAVVVELQKLIDARVKQVYDVDKKTYLIKLTGKDSGQVYLILESGIRIHTTKCEWPKNPRPSGFTMKLRKQIGNKRIREIKQIGGDRMVDIQFGSGEVGRHLIVELFSRGNVICTDEEYRILCLLRCYSDGESCCLAPQETYPLSKGREWATLNLPDLHHLLSTRSQNEQIKKSILPRVQLGQPFLEHSLRKVGINPDMKLNCLNTVEDLEEKLIKLVEELGSQSIILNDIEENVTKGYISYLQIENNGQTILQMMEFNPYSFVQNTKYEIKIYDTFTDAVDEFFSNLESQKMQLNIIEKEEDAMKKVRKIRIDQESRLQILSEKQLRDKTKADLIIVNASLIEEAIYIVRRLIAMQLSWGRIQSLIEESKQENDPIASIISCTKFEVNQISLKLRDLFPEPSDENKPVEVDIDLSLSAYANARKYYDHKKYAATKENKTISSLNKALKSAERKAQETIKTVRKKVAITLTKKVYWFEKFYWFISSDNYLIIGGRDKKQNEIIVKRYLKGGDLYVHADLVGASSVVIKNPSGMPVPRRTLDEAGSMAVCYSAAWATRTLCLAWWVHAEQVSKTPPSGEYLVTGSFIVRGRKHYLSPIHLQLGLTIFFQIAETSTFRHKDERKAKLDGESSASTIIQQDEMEETYHCNQIHDNPYQDKAIKNKFNEEETETTSGCSNLHNLITVKAISQSIVGTHAKSESNYNPKSSIKCNKNKQEKLKRGQRSKLKKIKEKYKDQDDEDKQLRMSILQSAGVGKKEKKKKSKSGNVPEKIKETLRTSGELERVDSGVKVELPEARLGMLALPTQQQDPEDELLHATPVISPYIGIRDSQTLATSSGVDSCIKEEQPEARLGMLALLTQQQDPEDELLHATPVISPYIGIRDSQTLATSSGVDSCIKEEQPEAEVPTELDMLALLTGQPDPEDELLHAIPVIAPYTAMLNNKFKMKIVPGLTKRGKAARFALEQFIKTKECSAAESELMKCVDNNSLSRNFPGSVKLSPLSH